MEALALRCYGFTKSLSQSDVNGECPAPLKLPGRPCTLRSEGWYEEEEEEDDLALVTSFKQTDFSPRWLNQSNSSCVAEPCPFLWGVT